MKVSVIATVKNEGETLRPLLDSLLRQSRMPDEIVICDGGSTDRTLKILKDYQRLLPLKIILAPDSNISQGRNQAISKAEGPIVACTDGGVVLHYDWLSEIVQPIEEKKASVVSGWFEPDPYTDFEVVMGATVLPDLADIVPEKFLPSSRSVAFLKKAWVDVGGYPDWLDYGEDVCFDLALRKENSPFIFNPKAVVFFRPRGNFRVFARQYYLYARGDGKANLWPKRHLIRYLTYLVGLPVIGRLIWRGKWVGWVFLISGIGIYCRRPAQRLWPLIRSWPPINMARAFVMIPTIRLVGDFSKMIGYPVGLIWRWRQRKDNRI